jgi:acyl-CoA dehydrogenase
MRTFVDKELIPYCHEWDESGDFVPRSVFQRCGEIGILTAGTFKVLQKFVEHHGQNI